jgi:hypothetical protein
VSARLIGELTDWLMSPAAQALDLTQAERNVLFVVAERAHERTRIMLRHRADDMQLVERIAMATGLAREQGLKRAFRGLASKGLEVRIPIKEGRDGRPVFTHEGHSMRFRLPEFPASVALPDRPPGPVDNPVDNSSGEGPVDAPTATRGGQNRAASQREGVKNEPPLRPQRGSLLSRPTPSNYTSSPSYKLDPSTSVRSPVAGLEGSPARADETATSPRFDLRSALCVLLEAAPEVQAAAIAQAEKDLGPEATTEALRIRAAEIAAKGIPA